VPFLVRIGGNVAGGPDARVVDDHIYAPKMTCDGLDCCLNLRVVGNVALDSENIAGD
jgi:hypothetical protein